MYVSKLYLKDFRNYTSETACFSPNTNILIGGNAQGKTNLAEALYVLSIGKSMRTPRDREMICKGKERAYLKAEAIKKGGPETVEMILDAKENKRVAIGSLPISRIGELMGVITTVLFSPEETAIIRESPSNRRRFMDIALSQLSKTYFYTLTRYNKILAQRNRALKSGNADKNAAEVWEIQLAETGSKIIKSRRGFLNRIAEKAEKAQSYLTSGSEKMEIGYESIDGTEVAEIKDNYLKMLAETRVRDMQYGYTAAGAHTDDFSVKVNGMDLRKFGSMGQQRTAALSLKLAEAEVYGEERGELPLLILDDVFGELDLARQIKLVQKIKDFQSVITCTHIEKEIESYFKGAKLFEINGGKILKSNDL